MFSIKRRKKRKNKKTALSILKKLREENRSTEEFEILVSRLSLEELIWMKLELSAKEIKNYKYFGFPIWTSLPIIVQEGMLRFALAATVSQKEAARFLGLRENRLRSLMKRFKIPTHSAVSSTVTPL